MIKTHWGTVIAERYERIVHGGRGDYVEIAEEDINRKALRIPKYAEWRLAPGWMGKVFYIEHRTTDTSCVKLYEQRRLVDYADYRLGFWYVSVKDVDIDDTSPPDDTIQER